MSTFTFVLSYFKSCWFSQLPGGCHVHWCKTLSNVSDNLFCYSKYQIVIIKVLKDRFFLPLGRCSQIVLLLNSEFPHIQAACQNSISGYHWNCELVHSSRLKQRIN